MHEDRGYEEVSYLLEMLTDRLSAIHGSSDLGINGLDWCSLLCDS